LIQVASALINKQHDRSMCIAPAALPGKSPAVNVAMVDAPPTSTVQMSAVEKWNGDRRLQTQVFPLAQNTVAIRSLDWDRDRFDIEFG
jgi:hypothetical protein